MKIVEVLYYNYFLFYRKILRDPDPFIATTLSLSFSESLLINAIIDYIAVIKYCYIIGNGPMFGVLILILAANYHWFHQKGKSRKIVLKKPALFHNSKLSILITTLFF